MRVPSPVQIPLLLPLALAAVLAACGDSTAPAPPPRLTLSVEAPAGDSLAQLGVDVVVALRDSVPIRQLRIFVDSAVAAAPQEVVDLVVPDARARVAAVTPATGRHVITVAVTDTAGAVASASVTRTFRLPTVRYAATRLPDLGYGAVASALNAGGDAAGYVVTAGGRKRPAVWRNGELSLLPVADTLDVTATRINASGDVLLQYPPRFGVPGASVTGYTSARVLRADGALLPIGPLYLPFSPPDVGGRTCCALAGDLNDRRQAVASNQAPNPWKVSLRVDVGTGVVDTALGVEYTRINNAGQRAGTRDMSGASALLTDGFAAPAGPAGPRAGGYCYAGGGASYTTYQHTVDLDDAANLLVRYGCGGTYAYHSAAGSVWLDRYLPRPAEPLGATVWGNIRLSRQGSLVAALDSAGAVHVWNAGTRRTVRAAAETAPFRFDGLGAVNAAGRVAVHGTDPATGRGAAFLLDPAGR